MKRFRRYLDYFLRWWGRRSPSTRALPRHLWQAVLNFFHNGNGARQAAALAYYAVFSLFPLSLLLAVAINTLLGPAVAQEQISRGLEIFLPPQTVELLKTNVSDALQQGGSFGLVAVIGLIWSALGLFANITSSLDLIFHVPATRSLWRQRLLAFLMTLILIVLIFASFITSGILSLFSTVLFTPSIWVTIGTAFLPLGLDMLIFALLFRFVPSRRVTWDAVWPAAIFGALGWELAKAGFGWYIQNLANFAVVYGGIATVIVLMTWAYVVALVFLLSAEFCAELDIWFETYQKPQKLLTLPSIELPKISAPFSRLETSSEDAPESEDL